MTVNGETIAMNGAGANRALICDVAVVGGGPAGIAAATRAAESGARVFVIDQGLRPGGQIWRHTDHEHLPPLAQRWIERCERSGARWLSAATVVDGTLHADELGRIDDVPEHELAVVQHDHPFVVRARSIVLATGARERFLPYPGWTLPNAMGVGGAQALLKGGADMRGRRVVIAGSGPLVLPVAAAMAHAGATLVAVAEQAAPGRVVGFGATLWSHPSKLADAMRYRAGFAGTSYRLGTWVERATGEGRVEHVTLTNGRRRWREACDLLCCSFGLVPNLELPRLLGCTVENG
ncbi:MAG TPA: FAD/NAD(P)-binding oxidoreductase, partial [Gemmatimonadaceae bacterium]|nr:FAD/NAD(P)-binding oxidoreductase [Gemmatimonadaceae bacterium]